MLSHMIFIEWNTIFIQQIKYPFKFSDIIFKYKIIFILVEYFLKVVSSNFFPLFTFWRATIMSL